MARPPPGDASPEIGRAARAGGGRLPDRRHRHGRQIPAKPGSRGVRSPSQPRRRLHRGDPRRPLGLAFRRRRSAQRPLHQCEIRWLRRRSQPVRRGLLQHLAARSGTDGPATPAVHRMRVDADRAGRPRAGFAERRKDRPLPGHQPARLPQHGQSHGHHGSPADDRPGARLLPQPAVLPARHPRPQPGGRHGLLQFAGRLAPRHHEHPPGRLRHGHRRRLRT